MVAQKFDRDTLAKWYARGHLDTDPGVALVYYLPTNADEREIRFIEVNTLMGERNENSLIPLTFGADYGKETQHQLTVLDVTPEQWHKIQEQKLHLPHDWSLEGAVEFRK